MSTYEANPIWHPTDCGGRELIDGNHRIAVSAYDSLTREQWVVSLSVGEIGKPCPQWHTTGEIRAFAVALLNTCEHVDRKNAERAHVKEGTA